jgi:hypothetical protein
MSRQDCRRPDEAPRRECRMNSNRFASLPFLHNRVFFTTAPSAGARACGGTGLFAVPAADLNA